MISAKKSLKKKEKSSFLWDRPAFAHRRLQSGMAGEYIVIQKEKLLSTRWSQTSTKNSLKIKTSCMLKRCVQKGSEINSRCGTKLYCDFVSYGIKLTGMKNAFLLFIASIFCLAFLQSNNYIFQTGT